MIHNIDAICIFAIRMHPYVCNNLGAFMSLHTFKKHMQLCKTTFADCVYLFISKKRWKDMYVSVWKFRCEFCIWIHIQYTNTFVKMIQATLSSMGKSLSMVAVGFIGTSFVLTLRMITRFPTLKQGGRLVSNGSLLTLTSDWPCSKILWTWESVQGQFIG